LGAASRNEKKTALTLDHSAACRSSRWSSSAVGVAPVTQWKLVGALDANNNLTGLHMRISGQSILAAVAPARLAAEGQFGYGFPNLLIEHAMVNPPIPPWFWRGVNNNQNAPMRPARSRSNSGAS
jgi:hypothetical protein